MTLDPHWRGPRVKTPQGGVIGITIKQRHTMLLNHLRNAIEPLTARAISGALHLDPSRVEADLRDLLGAGKVERLDRSSDAAWASDRRGSKTSRYAWRFASAGERV